MVFLTFILSTTFCILRNVTSTDNICKTSQLPLFGHKFEELVIYTSHGICQRCDNYRKSKELYLLFEIPRPLRYVADQFELDEQHTRPDEKLTLEFKLKPRDDA